MKSWVDVVTQPLGLAGFALACVFMLVAKRQRRGNTPWAAPAAFALAFIALIGALALSFWQSRHESRLEGPQQSTAAPAGPQKPAEPAIKSGDVRQDTAGGPAVANTGGNVSITISAPPSSKGDKRP